MAATAVGRRVFLATATLAVSVSAAGAQDVRLAGDPRNDAERAVQMFLDRGGYEVWARDTVLARDDVVTSHVLVVEATARVSGRIEGDVLVIDGDLFLRTRARVTGDIVVLGGGFYDSDLAEVGGDITYRPNERIRVRPTGGELEVFSEEAERDPFELDGTWGFHIPVYQRVDAVTLGWGAIARFDRAAGRPDLEGSVRYLTGPGDIEGSLRSSIYPSERLRLGVSASRATRTMDGWIRPTWYNSLSLLVADDDAFDYYRGDRLGVEAEWRSVEPPIWEDAPTWTVSFAGFWEDAESLEARDTWAIFESDPPLPSNPSIPEIVDPADRHPNPSIDDGENLTLSAAFDWMKRGESGRTAFGVGLHLFSDLRGQSANDPPSPDDLSHLLAEGRLSTRHATSWGHAWEVFAIARVKLAGDVAGQRYSTLGGPGTVATMPLRSMRGPEMVYADVGYAVPVLGMATLGGLDVFARASAGSAWGAGVPFRLEEALSGGIDIRLWEFAMETGVAFGSAAEGGTRTIWYFDVRTRRGARPTLAPAPGRGF
ncbi:MAG: polymer-forming cytoskeletal protein [Gemmatimonadota bacterium]|nr:polymer-forming cytoskeletal protein [Gemmatimonadota bacterium]